MTNVNTKGRPALRYRGCQYRQALKPEQEQLKKDYLLQQQLSKGAPDFDKMLEYFSTFAEYFDVLSGFELEVGDELVKEHEKQHDVVLNTNETLAFEQQHSVEIREKAEEVIREAFENEYRALSRHEGETCYRAVALRENVDPLQLTGLGVYWSLEEGGADTYDASADTEQYPYCAVFVAEVDPTYFNVEQMLVHNLIYPQETEVTFIKHAPIWVYGVSVTRRDGAPVGNSRMVAIEDFRRC